MTWLGHPGVLRLAALAFLATGVMLMLGSYWRTAGSDPLWVVPLSFLSPYLVSLLLLCFPRLAGAAAGSALGMLVAIVVAIYVLATAPSKHGLGLAYAAPMFPLIALTVFVLPGMALGLVVDWLAWRRSKVA